MMTDNWLARRLVYKTTGLQHDWFTTRLVYNTSGLQHQWFTTRLVYNTTGLQHDWFTTPVVYNTSGLQHDWFTTRLVYNTTGLQLVYEMTNLQECRPCQVGQVHHVFRGHPVRGRPETTNHSAPQIKSCETTGWVVAYLSSRSTCFPPQSRLSYLALWFNTMYCSLLYHIETVNYNSVLCKLFCTIFTQLLTFCCSSNEILRKWCNVVYSSLVIFYTWKI